MLVSPFTFFRGAAAVMANDLAGTPTSGLTTQLCGDAHLSNFGVYASPERRLVFDINDFDETLPGPWEWDVKRLAASMEVAARGNEYPGKQRREVVLATMASYRQSMRRLAEMPTLDVWYARGDLEDMQADQRERMTRRQRRKVSSGLAKARTHDNLQAFDKLTRVVDGRRRIIPDPPLIVPLIDLLPQQVDPDSVPGRLRDLLAGYRHSLPADRRVLFDRFELADMARKVVGVGSVGTRCWIVLLLGRDDNDPLFLQVKEAQQSVLAPFAGASRYPNEGERVVTGQRLMQAASDIFLGWQRLGGIDGRTRDFYVRQLRDWKGSVVVEEMVPSGMRLYGELCGRTLARAHARCGDPIAMAAYLGASDVFERAVTEFAVAYADQNERDHQAMTAAVADGRITAETGG
jgi:hypothetical protein